MEPSFSYFSNAIINFFAALIILCPVLHCMFVKRGKTLTDRLFYILAAAIILRALSGAFFGTLFKYDPEGVTMTVAQAVKTILVIISCYLLAIYLFALTGHEKLLKKYSAAIAAICAACVLSRFIITPNNLGLVTLPPFAAVFFSLVPAAVTISGIALSLVLLWKLDRFIVVLPTLMLLISIYMGIALHVGKFAAVILAVSVLYIYLSVNMESLLIQIGGVILPLFVTIILITGNNVTAAAFSSYLTTMHDKNDIYLKQMEMLMEAYHAMPWLLDYWVNHAAEVKAYLLAEEDIPFEDNHLFEVTVQEAENFTASDRLKFAAACYKRIDNAFISVWSTNQLDDLFLIIPVGENAAVTVFDAERDSEGNCKLGNAFDIIGERQEWNNYASALNSRINWVWGRYDKDDDFGFFREIPYTYVTEGIAILSNSIKRSEIYAHMDYISFFRMSAMAYLLFASAIILLLLYLLVLRPLSIISGTIRRYHADKDSAAATKDMERLRFRNEMGAFAGEFALLTKEIDRYTAEVSALAGERERMETELSYAAQIQRAMLPKLTDEFTMGKGFSLFASMDPAREVGGDFFDFFMIDPDRMAFLVADVSDKGMGAALFMAISKAVIRSHAFAGGSPSEILKRADMVLLEGNEEGMFVTVFLAILKLSTGEITACNAGHDYPIVCFAHDGKRDGFELREEEHGGPLAFLHANRLPDLHWQLRPGDRVFLYTDGINEAHGKSNEQFGVGRMIEVLNTHIEDDDETVCRAMKDAVNGFMKGEAQFDDMTTLCLTWHGI